MKVVIVFVCLMFVSCLNRSSIEIISKEICSDNCVYSLVNNVEESEFIYIEHLELDTLYFDELLACVANSDFRSCSYLLADYPDKFLEKNNFHLIHKSSVKLYNKNIVVYFVSDRKTVFTIQTPIY